MTLTGGEHMTKLLKEIVDSAGPGKRVRVGFLEESTCGKDNDQPAPQVAFWNEFGTKTIPQRPFFRNMIRKNSQSWGRLAAACLKNAKFNTDKALRMVGEVLVDQLVEEIEEFKSPGNAESTKLRKGFDEPLQDSKNMKRAVAYAVSDGQLEEA